MSRPSDGMTLEELREEYDWIYEFQSRMAERITGDKDVHNLVDYVDKLEAKNAKLRTFLSGGSIVTDYWKDEDGTMHVLTTDGEHIYEYMRGGLADENAMLRDELDFCLKHAPNCDECEAMLDCWECLRADPSQKERKRLDYENGQLRELCKLFFEYVSYDRCEGCICKSACNDGEIDECVQLTEILETAHELEIDVH